MKKRKANLNSVRYIAVPPQECGIMDEWVKTLILWGWWDGNGDIRDVIITREQWDKLLENCDPLYFKRKSYE